MKHSYWGIAFLACFLAAIGCMDWVVVFANTWPGDLLPILLTILFFLLANECANKIIDKEQKK